MLSYSEGGRTKFVMLPADQVAPVRAAAERYRAERLRLEEQGNAGLAELVAGSGPGGGDDGGGTGLPGGAL